MIDLTTMTAMKMYPDAHLDSLTENQKTMAFKFNYAVLYSTGGVELRRVLADDTSKFLFVDAPHFSATLLFLGEQVFAATPVLTHWVGKTVDELFEYAKERGWKITSRAPGGAS